MIENKIKHLKEMHMILDKKIDGLEKNGNISDAALTQLKKQRLRLKDQIAQLESQAGRSA